MIFQTSCEAKETSDKENKKANIKHKEALEFKI